MFKINLTNVSENITKYSINNILNKNTLNNKKYELLNKAFCTNDVIATYIKRPVKYLKIQKVIINIVM